MENIPLQFLISINIIDLVRTGGALWTFIHKGIFCYSIGLDSTDSNFLL